MARNAFLVLCSILIIFGGYTLFFWEGDTNDPDREEAFDFRSTERDEFKEIKQETTGEREQKLAIAETNSSGKSIESPTSENNTENKLGDYLLENPYGQKFEKVYDLIDGGDVDEAISELNKMAKEGVGGAETYKELGILYLDRKENYDQAKYYFNKALEKDPNHPVALNEMIRILDQNEGQNKVDHFLNSQLSRNGNPRLITRASQYWEEKGNWEKAQEVVSGIVGRKNVTAYDWQNYAKVQNKVGNKQLALKGHFNVLRSIKKETQRLDKLGMKDGEDNFLKWQQHYTYYQIILTYVQNGDCHKAYQFAMDKNISLSESENMDFQISRVLKTYHKMCG